MGHVREGSQQIPASFGHGFARSCTVAEDLCKLAAVRKKTTMLSLVKQSFNVCAVFINGSAVFNIVLCSLCSLLAMGSFSHAGFSTDVAIDF